MTRSTIPCTFIIERLVYTYYLRISSLLEHTRRWKQINWRRSPRRTTFQLGFAILLELSTDSYLLVWCCCFPSCTHIIIHFGFKQAYASILYLHVPDNFKIVLRGCDVEPHNIVNDLMYRECVLYKPQIAGLTEVHLNCNCKSCCAFLTILIVRISPFIASSFFRCLCHLMKWKYLDSQSFIMTYSFLDFHPCFMFDWYYNHELPYRLIACGLLVAIGCPFTCYKFLMLVATYRSVTSSTWDSVLNKIEGKSI